MPDSFPYTYPVPCIDESAKVQLFSILLIAEPWCLVYNINILKVCCTQGTSIVLWKLIDGKKRYTV